MGHTMHPVRSVLDRGTGPNIFQEEALGAEWPIVIQTDSSPSSKNVTNQKVTIIGTITLRVKIGLLYS